jgi:hypothetical protein
MIADVFFVVLIFEFIFFCSLITVYILAQIILVEDNGILAKITVTYTDSFLTAVKSPPVWIACASLSRSILRYAFRSTDPVP